MALCAPAIDTERGCAVVVDRHETPTYADRRRDPADRRARASIAPPRRSSTSRACSSIDRESRPITPGRHQAGIGGQHLQAEITARVRRELEVEHLTLAVALDVHRI